MTHRPFLLAPVVALQLTMLSGCASKSKSEGVAAVDAGAATQQAQMVAFDDKTLARLGLKVEPAGKGGDEHRLMVPGTIEYNLNRYAEVGTLVEGRVASVNAQVGTPVKKGFLLASLLVPSIASAQADYLGAQAELKVAELHVKRQQALYAANLTTAGETESAQGDTLQAEAKMAAASAKLKVLGVPLPSSGATIVPNGSLSLVAPIDGVVVAREAVLGGFLEPNDTAFIVADPTMLWATIQVFEADIPYFQIGAQVSLTVDALPGAKFDGKIALLEPEVGKTTRAILARIEVTNKDGALRPGLFVRASVPLPESATSGRLLVPAAAVQPLGERDVVFVERSPGHFEVRSVELARRTAQVAEIASGLSVGEPIVVVGAFVLRGEVTKQ